ncbi:carotenoid biosynthesis protein [Modestobacter excelsi]|uniref:carotenoid biosynthesis protein n=1 Tax=Modestobacter excelsi TaxID=2213161 RepID=UPI00110D048C|nr:carotenoid biosynthesis protein [Modestobacter excelsi]
MTAALAVRRPAGSGWVPVVPALLLVATAIAYPLTDGAAQDAVSWAIVLLGATVSGAHAAVSRGLRTGLAVLGLVAGVAVLFEALGLSTGFPYGEYSYSDELGPTVLGVPFLVPLAWLMMAWPSWVLAAWLTPRSRPARVLVAAYVFAGWDVVLDPQMVQAGYWRWAHPSPGLPGIDTVPLTNLAGWLLAGVVLMTLLDLLAGSARSGTSDAAPLLVLTWMTLGGALAHAGWLGLPGSAAWAAVLAVPVLAAVVLRLRR